MVMMRISDIGVKGLSYKGLSPGFPMHHTAFGFIGHNAKMIGDISHSVFQSINYNHPYGNQKYLAKSPIIRNQEA